MNLTSATAQFGLLGRATPTQNNVRAAVQIGDAAISSSLANGANIISFDALIAGVSSLVVDVSDLDSTGSTAWSAGTAQVETATAAGTIGTAGNAEVIVTANAVTGSPLTFSVAVAASDTAADWAAKVRTALSENEALTTFYTVGGTSTAITLTHKGTISPTIEGDLTPAFPANDSSLNISLDNDTCTGITTATTSANTTAGVASAGVYVPALDGNDFEGNPTGGATKIYGLYIHNDSTSADAVTVTQSTVLVDYGLAMGSVLQSADTSGNLNASDITIEPDAAGPCLVTVTLVTD